MDQQVEENLDEYTTASRFAIRYPKPIGIAAILAGVLFAILTYQAGKDQRLDDNLFTFCGNFALAFAMLTVGGKFLLQGATAAMEMGVRKDHKMTLKPWIPVLIGLLVGAAVGYAVRTMIPLPPVAS
jgi:hypothetical protein